LELRKYLATGTCLIFLIFTIPCTAMVKGYWKIPFYYFTASPENDKERFDLETNLESDFPLYSVGKGFFSFKFYGNDLGGESKGDLAIDEAYLDLYTLTTDIRLGKQYIFWGRADGTETPTNNINPVDYSRIKPDFEEQRISINALKVNYFKDSALIFQGIWIPEFTPSKLPDFSFPSFINLKNPRLPTSQIKNSSWGIKIDRMGSRIDFSLSYLYTWDSFPDYEFDLSQIPIINLIPVHHRLQIYGADFATTFEELDLRGEVAYFQTRDENGDSLSIKNPNLRYILEVGYPVIENLNVIFQLVGKKVFHFKSPNEYPGLESLAREFSVFYGEQKEWQNSLVVNLTHNIWHEKLKLEILSSYNLTMQEYLLSSQVSYELGGGFNLDFGGMVFEGKSNTQFGMMDDKDFLYLEIKQSF